MDTVWFWVKILATSAPGLRVAPLAAASALPAIAFGAQGFEELPN
jgi:hypothetical protein